MLQGRGQHERHPALGRGHRGQPVAGRRHHRAVHGADLVQHPERHLDRLGLAPRPAQVRLKGVPEPAVGVLVGGQRGQHRPAVAAQEQVGEAVAVDQPAGAPDEPGRALEQVGHSRSSVGSLDRVGTIPET
jgi:hypothetical protein